jgi:hypothetical protein
VPKPTVVPFPFDENEAFALAQRDLWEKVGNFCYPDNPRTTENIMEFDVNADIPHVFVNPASGIPEKVKYLRFPRVGKVRVRLDRGTIEASTGWREARGKIREAIEAVETSVEKAVLQKGAARFSELPFAEHMHTPLVDILSHLVYYDRLETEHWKTNLRQEADELKFTDYVQLLESVDLVRTDGPHVLPGNILVGIMERCDNAPEMLRASLKHFFMRGVDNINSVRRVIGPQLRLSSKIYEAALEWGPDQGLDREAVRVAFQASYPSDSKKALQFPRYLMQLERVGVVTVATAGGGQRIHVEPTLYEEVAGTGTLLEPFRKALVTG